MTAPGHFQTSGGVRARSVRPSTTDIQGLLRHVRLVPGTDIQVVMIHCEFDGQCQVSGPGEAVGWSSLPFHIEGDRYALYAFARLDHILCGFRIFLEVCRLQMRLERVRIGVDLKKSDA